MTILYIAAMECVMHRKYVIALLIVEYQTHLIVALSLLLILKGKILLIRVFRLTMAIIGVLFLQAIWAKVFVALSMKSAIMGLEHA